MKRILQILFFIITLPVWILLGIPVGILSGIDFGWTMLVSNDTDEDYDYDEL